MSWLKLNDSLNKVKGQITSFAQEVLAEGIVNEPEQDEAAGRFNAVLELDQAQQKIGQLTGLCATQDQEIATLRKQIAEYQQQLQCQRQSPKPPTELPASGSKLPDQQHGTSTSTVAGTSAASPLEDSWFWDPEQNVSSTSSSSKKGDENDSPRSGSDLTTIPLETPATEGEIIERLHRQLADKRQQLKKQQLENALLAEKLTQVSSENRELNENIEALDKQQEQVVENLLTVKKELQDRCTQLEEELRVKQGEASVAQELDELRKKHKLLEQSYVQSCHESVRLKTELERIVVDNVDTVSALEHEIDELKSSLQTEENRPRDSTDAADKKINALTVKKSNLEQQVATLRDDTEVIRNKLQEAENECQRMKKLEADYESLQSELDELKQKAENDAYVPLQEEDQADLEELRRTYQEQLAEVERWKSDCDHLQEDNLILQRNAENLQSKLAKLESQLKEKDELLLQQTERKPVEDEQKQQLQREVSELQNELRSVIIDNSVQLDAKEKEWQEKLNFLKAENSRIQHSKDTLEADLIQYEKECASLMKNNDLLIAEIENLKSKKLETINENAEDSIIVLEKQLEDCSMLNKSLEDEYNEVKRKLEEVLEEREELESKVESLQNTLKERSKGVKDLQLKVESLESEKSHLELEIAEAQTKPAQQQDTDDQIELYRTQAESLQAQLTTINEDHASLVLKLQQLQQTSVENIKQSEAKILELETSLGANERMIKQLREELQDKTEKIAELTTSEESLKLIQDRLEAETQKCIALAAEKENMEAQQKSKLEEIDQLKSDYERLSQVTSGKLAEQASSMDALTQQKEDLVQLITTKHNESVQYHAEIQRLSQLLQMQQVATSECQQCAALRERIVSLEAQTGKLADFDRMTDQIQFLREKSDILTNNLMTEQTNQKLLQQEKQELTEQKNGLARDLERLRQHLLEIEEAHTQETVELQQRYDETRAKLQALEEEVKHSTNALTSASIRASQHAETLQTQYQLLQQQRDELVAKLNAADDRDQRNLASLTNLQCALEQFQINKDRDIELATSAIRKQVEQSQARESALKAEIRQLQQQLSDAKNGLLAAARISDQLEIAQVTVATLKDELAKNSEKYQTLESRLQATEAGQADKVEKTLVKNLLIGYIVAPNQNDKHQILKLISAVLTMDQSECIKIGLNRPSGGWLNNILGGGGSPQSANNYNKESLTEAFVKFLEKESTPRQPNTAGSGLLNIMTHEHQPTATSSRTNTPVPQQQQTQQPTADQNHNPILATTGAVQPVQPILLGETTLLQQVGFQPARSSSSILKDILSDS
ncbi:thyroid receptor-interacting protein 11 [Wyeomyia smithii]|uniref:thyroid receptor-interacting protein 11 n=1 Tax=Wyeomyia smithii TaxID=174621 RepID=UPI002467DA46|nr:thyroid receptor-interacting protein 11 [Wyeomyia smithii]